MHVTKETISPTSFKLSLVADQALLDQTKQAVLQQMGKTLKLQGFRAGKAPINIIERSVDPGQLQTEFLEQAVNQLYVAAISQEKLLPAAQPQISITKFVPFTTLEVTAEVEAVGNITLPDLSKIKVKRRTTTVADSQIDDTIKNLQTRLASRNSVNRAAVDGDEVLIDFSGVDTKSKESIAGADGKDYALVLGSGNFIPGFEEQLIGSKAKTIKDFDITFPADYGVADLQNKKVSFSVTVKEVREVSQPKLDKDFAAQVGPFKSVDELKKDIRRELKTQAAQDDQRSFESDIVESIVNKSIIDVPASLVDDEVERIEQQERQNVVYRGQTWQEHLDSEGVSEEEHRTKNRPAAETRVKAGLVLGEIAEQQRLKVSPEELEVRIQLLKGQYASDQKMQSELDKPENRRDIMSRMLTEKTLDYLKSLQAA